MRRMSPWVLAVLASCGWVEDGPGDVPDMPGASTGEVSPNVLGEGPWAECTWQVGPGDDQVSETWLSCPFSIFPSDAARVVNRGPVAYLQLAALAVQGYARIEEATVEVIEAPAQFFDPNLHFIDGQGRLSEWRRGYDSPEIGSALQLGTYDAGWSYQTVDPDASNLAALSALNTSEPMLGFLDLSALGFVFQQTEQGWSKAFVADLSEAVGWEFGVDTSGRVFVTSFRPITSERWRLESRAAAGVPLVFAEVDVWEIGPLFHPGGRAPQADGSLTAMAAFFERDASVHAYTSGAGTRVVPDSRGPELDACSVADFDEGVFDACASQCREEVSGRTSRGMASSWIDADHVLLAFVRSRLVHEITLWESCGPDGLCNCSYDQRTRELDATVEVMTLDVQTGDFEDVLEFPLAEMPGETFTGRHGVSMSVDGPDVAILVSDEISRARILQLQRPL